MCFLAINICQFLLSLVYLVFLWFFIQACKSMIRSCYFLQNKPMLSSFSRPCLKHSQSCVCNSFVFPVGTRPCKCRMYLMFLKNISSSKVKMLQRLECKTRKKEVIIHPIPFLGYSVFVFLMVY